VPTPGSQTYPWVSDRVLLACAGIYLSTTILEGPLRFLLYSVGAASVLYVRDALAAVPVALAAISWAVGTPVAVPLAGALGVLLIHLGVGILSLPMTFQALFGLKMFLPMLLGIAIAPILYRRPQSLVTFCGFALVITCLGVLANMTVEFPWIGVSYDTAFGEKTAGKEWYAGDDGNARLPGLTRSSVTAASIALMALPPVLAGGTSLLRKVLCTALSAATIYFTTSKGPLIAIPILLIQVFFLTGLKSKVLSGVFVSFMNALCLVLPITLMFMPPRRADVPSGFSSFMDRVEDEWPRAMNLYEHAGQALWGRGLGGIGTAQSMGEPALQNSGDNVMIYLLVVFGVLGPLYVAIYTYYLARHTSEREYDDFSVRLTHGWTAAWIADGIVSGMIEDATTGTTLGVLIGTVLVRGVTRVPARSVPTVRLASVRSGQ